ncbi:hypothetical protein H9W95_19025 [Flavobacterium lindanitolerans]|nr:hypothetical protein [Flavobacterium lindanitolerans]
MQSQADRIKSAAFLSFFVINTNDRKKLEKFLKDKASLHPDLIKVSGMALQN